MVKMNCAGTPPVAPARTSARRRVAGRGRSGRRRRRTLEVLWHEEPTVADAFGPNAWLVDDMYEQYRRIRHR